MKPFAPSWYLLPEWFELERKYLTACHAARVAKGCKVAVKATCPNPGGGTVGRKGKPVESPRFGWFPSAAAAARRIKRDPSAIFYAIQTGCRCAKTTWSYAAANNKQGRKPQEAAA